MAKLSLFVGSDDLIMVGCGWLWEVVSGGGEIMTGCMWSWVVWTKLWLVVGGGGEIMASREIKAIILNLDCVISI